MVHFEKSDLLRLARTVSPALFESEYVPDQMALDLVAQINDLMQKLSDLLVVAEAPKVDSTFILNQDSPNGANISQNGEIIESKLILAKKTYKVRRLRDIHFSNSRLFSDPAWDILLDLYISKGEARPISIKSACIAACVPGTTALRWISLLEREGLVTKTGDRKDKRRHFLEITASGIAKIEKCIFEGG